MRKVVWSFPPTPTPAVIALAKAAPHSVPFTPPLVAGDGGKQRQ